MHSVILCIHPFLHTAHSIPIEPLTKPISIDLWDPVLYHLGQSLKTKTPFHPNSLQISDTSSIENFKPDPNQLVHLAWPRRKKRS